MKTLTLGLLTILLLSGCRTAKPASSSQTKADNITVSADSTYSLHHDSVSISEAVVIMAEDRIEFVEEGGKIYVSADGSMILSGVLGVIHSDSRKAGRMITRDSLSIVSQSKDSVSAIHKATSHTEIKTTASQEKIGWRRKCVAIVLAILLLIFIFIPRFRQKFNL